MVQGVAVLVIAAPAIGAVVAGRKVDPRDVRMVRRQATHLLPKHAPMAVPSMAAASR